MKNIFVLVLSFSLLPMSLFGSRLNLLPLPKQIAVAENKMIATPARFNFSDSVLSAILPYGKDGFELRVNYVDSIPGAYDYTLFGFPNESYKLNIADNGVSIDCVTPTGAVRAAQTLCQLAESDSVQIAVITDWPAFKVRGYMHDVGRDYISVETLIKQLRLLSRFKVNVFHWHLTENQAWRLEIKSHPELTDSSAMTRHPGKYYTQADVARVVNEAKRLAITIIPEIDMPGHSDAFVRATGHDMQTAEGMNILRDVLREVVSLFPNSPYIHIGADEKQIVNPDFLPTMTAFVHTLGKKVMAWNPIMGVKITPDTGFDMTQMWSTAGRAVKGIPNIDCRYNYVNHFDVFADLAGIYKSNIYYVPQGNPDIAGTITGVWNDRRLSSEDDIMSQNNFYANVIASAERAWKGGGKQYIETGGTTIPNYGEEFDEFADFERRFLYHKEHSLKGEPVPYRKQTHMRWLITDSLGNEYVATGAAVYLRHTWGNIVPGLFADGQHGNFATAVTHIFSPQAQKAQAYIEFQNYSRSERDLAPEAGKWDRKGSRVFLNGSEILPPAWDNTGVAIGNESLLRNENFAVRKPIEVNLHAGWNTVNISLPYAPAPGVRLNKWMFTFLLEAPSGPLFHSPYLFNGVDQ